MSEVAAEDQTFVGTVKASAWALLRQWHILLFLFLGALVPNINMYPYIGEYAQTVTNICQMGMFLACVQLGQMVMAHFKSEAKKIAEEEAKKRESEATDATADDVDKEVKKDQ